MPNETVSAVITINAPAETVFAVLADPTSHAAIDGTGWVREPLDGEHLTEAGQIFRMAMYHPNHPDGSYEMANKVRIFNPPRTISWEPGQEVAGSGNLEFGGWIWRYDLNPISQSETEVTLSYDWSAVPQFLREHIQFPPFASDHLHNSLSHLAEIAVSQNTASK
ncbi:MAG: SRPBCC family protein [Pseudonocardiaceae bacterium]